MGVASDSDRCASVFADSANLAALKTNVDVLARDYLGTVVSGLFLLGNQDCVGTSTATEYSTALGSRADVEDDSANRNHVHGQAVASPGRLGCQNTGIDDATHAVEKVLGDTGTVAVDDVAGTHTLGSNDVALAPSGLVR